MSQRARVNPLPEGYYWRREHQRMAVTRKSAFEILLYVVLVGREIGKVYAYGGLPILQQTRATVDIIYWDTGVADFGADLDAAFTFMSNKILFGDT
jgi:hypothetical protein